MTRKKTQSQTTRRERIESDSARTLVSPVQPSQPCPCRARRSLHTTYTPDATSAASISHAHKSSKHAKPGQVGTPPHETAPPPHSQSCWCSTIFGGSFHVGRLGSDDTFDGGSEHTGGPARPAAGDAAGRERSGDSERAMSAQGTPDRSVVGRPFFCHCAGVQHLMGGRLCVEGGGVSVRDRCVVWSRHRI